MQRWLDCMPLEAVSDAVKGTAIQCDDGAARRGEIDQRIHVAANASNA